MIAAMEPREWLTFIEREYLSTFIREGGAAIKFAIPRDDSAREQVSEGLNSRAREMGFLAANVDASATKIHLAEDFFFRVADQIPWQQLTLKVIARLAELPEGETDGPSVEQIATRYGVGRKELLLELRPKIVNNVSKNRALSKDFRVAMTHLCIAEISGGEGGSTTFRLLTDWLTGRNNAVSAVKPYQIFSRINRTNARFLLESLLRWVRFAGLSGLVIVCDLRRLAVSRNPHDDLVHYSKAAVLDAYEVLREFLDGADRLTGFLMVLLPDVAFLDDFSRGIHAYQALKFRIYDEIHDKSLVNPLASLVRLSSAAGLVTHA
jgi:hypothetical protein